MIVGTSTSCSASCVSRAVVRTGTSSGRILGTSIICSGTGMSVSKERLMSYSCSTICGTSASRICTMDAQQTKSTMCSMVCRWTRSCGRGSTRTPHRTPRSVFVKQLEEHPVELGSQPPRPCPSSVPVGRRTLHQPPPCRSCGGRLRTRPLRHSATHVANLNAGVAAFSAMRSRVRHAATCRPPGHDRTVTQKETRTPVEPVVVSDACLDVRCVCPP